MILGKGAYMFQLDYRIVHSEYDDFIGQNGFLQIKCNECKYGEIYPRLWIKFHYMIGLKDLQESLNI